MLEQTARVIELEHQLRMNKSAEFHHALQISHPYALTYRQNLSLQYTSVNASNVSNVL